MGEVKPTTRRVAPLMIPLQSTHDAINAHGGLNLIGKLIAKFCPLDRLFAPESKQRSDAFSLADALRTQIGLLAMGRSQYEDIESFRRTEASPGFESFAQS